MFCNLEEKVVFVGDYTLNHKRPRRANRREFDRVTNEYSKPNGGTVIISCDPTTEIRDLIFDVEDYFDLERFFHDHLGKVFQYTNHYGKTHKAVFLKGLVIIETQTDCLHEIRVSMRCFPLTVSP